MNKLHKNSYDWYLPEPILYESISEIKLPICIKAVLLRRGLISQEKIEEYLHPPNLPEPYLHFADLSKAIERIKDSAKNKEKVAICGDYDADGITSSVILIKTLNYLGIESTSVIPNRLNDGYGLNKDMIEKIRLQGINLCITVDNGVNAIEALNYANQHNIDVIITDHHKIPESKPNCFAIIHPELTPKNSPYKYVAGVGVAYIIASKLIEHKESYLSSDLKDLLCIGTIADMAELKGANIFWLKRHMPNLRKTKISGLRSIYKLAGIEGKNISSEDIGFKIAPRINAVGRISDPSLVINLLTEENENEAMRIAKKCDKLNSKRKGIVDAIELEARAIISSNKNDLPSFILIAQDHWHQGVIGIVASRILDEFNRPTAILTGTSEGNFTGSVRSKGRFSTIDMLSYCSDHLIKYGGHKYAGGFTVDCKKLGKLQEKILEYTDEIMLKSDFIRSIYPEANLKLDDITSDFWVSHSALEPYGNGRKKPLFWANNCKVEEIKELRGGYTKILLNQGGKSIYGIYWKKVKLNLPNNVDIAFHLTENNWSNSTELQLELIAIRNSNAKPIIQKGDHIYTVEHTKQSEITITNNLGKQISAKVNANSSVINNDTNHKHKYISKLFKEASLILGLTP